MLNISFWKLHAVKVKKANKKKCKTFFWQKKCCLLAVSFMSTSSTSSNSFFNFETNFHSVFFFNFVFFQLVFFSFKKTTKNVYKSSVFPFCWCLRLAEEEGGRGRGEPDAQLRSGSQQPRGEFEKVVKKMWRKKMYEKMLRCFLRKQIWQHIRKKQQNKKFEFQKLRYFTFHRRIRSYGS